MTELTELEKRIRNAIECGNKWAAAEEKWFQLDETKKSVLADLIKDLDDGDTSETKLERLARSRKEWKEHIQNLAVAKGEQLKARVRWECSVAWYEACRTAEATNRVKMNVLRDTV